MRTTCSITAFTLALLLYCYCLAEGCRIEKKGRHKKKKEKKKKKKGGKGYPEEDLAHGALGNCQVVELENVVGFTCECGICV
jgi:hypothetical protein